MRKAGICESADSGRAKIPEGGRFAAAVLLFSQQTVCYARPESASAASRRAKIPEGGRFAAAALLFSQARSVSQQMYVAQGRNPLGRIRVA
jgi:hypothetical protein